MAYRMLGVWILLLLSVAHTVYAADGYTLVFDESLSTLVVNEHNQVTVRATEPRSLTTCFELESSGDGKFYSSSKVLIGDKIKSNIPKNENGVSNRNFFYMPGASGEDTFTLKTFLRPESVSTSCDTWVPDGEAWAVYETTMTVGESSNGSGDEEDDKTLDDTSTTTPENTSQNETITRSSGGGGSAHASSAPLSTAHGEITFQVSAGRERVATVGSPVQFDAVVTKSGEFSRPYFRWSFGDGTEYAGDSVFHAYVLPGTYEVVLNAAAGTKSAVARTRIEVSAPQVALLEVDPVSGYAVFKNYAAQEVNIGGWEVKGDDSMFVFPADTIMRPGGRLPVAFTTMNLPVGSTTTMFVVRDPQGKELLSYSTTTNSGVVEQDSQTVARMEQELTRLLATVEALQSPPVTAITVAPVTVAADFKSTSTVSDSVLADVSTTTSSTTQLVAGAVLAIPPQASWYSPLLQLPRLGFDLVRGILP